MNQLARNQSKFVLAPGIQMVGMSAVMNGSVTLDDVAMALSALQDLRDKPQWGIGDLLNASELKFGEAYAQIYEITRLKYSSCQTYTSMARSFKPEERNPDIGYNYHRIVQSCNYDKRKIYLQHAIDEDLSEGEFRQYVRQREGKKKKKGGDDDEHQLRRFVGAVSPVPFERNNLWDLMSNPAAIRVSRDQLEQLGLPIPETCDSILVIGIQLEEKDINQSLSEDDFDHVDVNDPVIDDVKEVPFGA